MSPSWLNKGSIKIVKDDHTWDRDDGHVMFSSANVLPNVKTV